ncbi:alcohol dehydrogenase GroES-like domain-containing protein [Lophiostoma macrostomum CBS 122681]|uniref:Alcohol dehydrogenase GroES-like domain-containing protein n=1 Tax=Lophiostoma macrostomum CBS 122681 TaxID=1314788 RepID=A0A6A6SJ05_9PLEO|nr:alcohol dehydrogenase GroES-like domain-containing protein [Lophiostoma macrostomum CBS 122681]
MKALVGDKDGGYRLAEDVAIPEPKPGMMLCRVHAVSLSPYDAKIVEYSVTPDAVGGCDFAGTIVKVGQGVTRFKEGERILAVTFGLNPLDKTAGAFAEYALAIEDLSCHIPDGMSFDVASSMGVGIATAGLALFEASGLHLPLSRPDATDADSSEVVLVSGGATSTGTMATQLLRIAGYTPIVTCSPANNAFCESYGAAACFDYHSPTCGADIRDYTSNNLSSVLDCVTDAPTMKMCYDAIGSSGGRYIAIESITPVVKYTRRDVSADWLIASDMVGDAVLLPGAYGRPSTPEHRQFAATFFHLVDELLHQGRIRSHALDVRGGGLAKVPAYLDDLRGGNVRAKRLVVPVASG